MIMKKLLLLFPLLLSCLWGIAADEFRVAELRCEYRDNPLAINTLTPQFSWQTLSVGRGFLQAGYQIQVASDPADLARGRKLLWDEQRKSDVSLHVRYAGRTLKPGQRYYWRVRVSDAAGNYSPWSEIRSFASACSTAAIGTEPGGSPSRSCPTACAWCPDRSSTK